MPLESLTPEELIKRMEAAAAHEFARAERALHSNRPQKAEARLRIMAHLVKMLSELKRMRRDSAKNGENEPPEKPPRDLKDLRAELARRIDRYRENRLADVTARAPFPEGKGISSTFLPLPASGEWE